MGLEAVARIRGIFPDMKNLAPLALRWILDHEAVSCIIPGVSRVEQLASNFSAMDIAIHDDQRWELDNIYEELIKEEVHHLW